MTPEELDEARAKEAWRIWNESEEDDALTASIIAARLAREGWTPPEPMVDPDILAFREWAAAYLPVNAEAIHRGLYDEESAGFLAGARMAREQERERAKVLMECVERYAGPHAAMAIAKYRGEA